MAARPGPPGQLRATFPTREAADEAVVRLHDRGVPDDDIRIDDADDRQHMLSRRQRLEMDHSVTVPATNLITPAQVKGAVRWTAIGAVAGAVLVGPVGLVLTLGTFSRAAGVAICAAVGALAGAAAGFTYGGGRQPEVDGETRSWTVAEVADVIVAVDATSVDEARSAIEVIESSQATDAEYETTGTDPLAERAAEATRRVRHRHRLRHRNEPTPDGPAAGSTRPRRPTTPTGPSRSPRTTPNPNPT